MTTTIVIATRTTIKTSNLDSPILANVKPLQLPQVRVHIIRRNGPQKGDVVVAVKARQVCVVHERRPKDIHLLVQVVIDD